VGYGALRFVAEFFREPDVHIGFDALGWMTRGQLLCLPMLVAGLCLLYWAYRPKTR
jgi:phosphatidylglycerol:prolipoprotein diacylglycerol transferase